MRTRFFSLMLLAAAALAAGCSRGATTESESSLSGSREALPPDSAIYRLDAEPPGAQDVIAVREAAEDTEPVLVIGRIGGDTNPWVEGRAAFSLVDRSLEACSDREGDDCPVPWDYCCEVDKLPTARLLVKVVNEDGALVKTDARALLGLKELDTVVVRGTAQRDDAGNLVVLTDGIFVRP